MSKLDHRCRSLLRRSRRLGERFAELGERAEFALEDAAVPEEAIEVLARCRDADTVERLGRAGLQVWSEIPGGRIVVAGQATEDVLEGLAEVEGVERIELSRPMTGELDVAREDTRVEPLHTPPQAGAPPVRGAGTVLGIIDTGIDYQHPKFLDADGTSRILFLWDQRVAGDHPNVPFGREYTRAELDQALAAGEPLDVVPHRDTDGHGTHVAGIAAGNGGGGLAFRGVAPDAELIVVAARSDGDTLGRSASSLAAYQYIVDRAAGRPLVINQSQGMNGGGHSGETVLETGIDNLLRQPNVVAVKSAGNEQEKRIHAGGRIRHGETLTLRFRIEQSNTFPQLFELWYGDEDTINVAVKPPGEPRLAFVSPDDGELDFVTQAGNEVWVQFDRDSDDTGSTLGTIEVSPHQRSKIRPGTWRLRLHGEAIANGRFDVWIERAPRPAGSNRFQARFTPGSADDTRTISVPGTARRIITVGSYITRESFPRGQISPFSSRGPTRDGRRKPEIAAPGQFLVSARSSASAREPFRDALHTLMPGTSMAAPHVAGVAALVLGTRPGLTCEQVRQILTSSARTDGFADTAPDDTWGAGKVDAAAAVELAAAAVFPVVSDVAVQGTTLSWTTDVPTTATVRFHASLRRLLLGQALGTRTVLDPGTEHTVDLADQPAGAYFCEILAFTEDGFRTTDENLGSGFEVTVAD